MSEENDYTKQLLITAIHQSGFKLSRHYSGRAMYGRECVGFEIHGDVSVIAAVSRIVHISMANLGVTKDTETIVRAFEGAKYDSLGLNTIIYFPLVEDEFADMSEEYRDKYGDDISSRRY